MSLSLSNISMTTRLQLGVRHGIAGEEDPNAKYVKHVDEYWLDQEVWHGIQTKQARGLDK